MRSSRNHWFELNILLAGFERCFEACARLDATRPMFTRDTEELKGVERRLLTLRSHLDVEIARVTSERLLAALPAKVTRQTPPLALMEAAS